MVTLIELQTVQFQTTEITKKGVGKVEEKKVLFKSC